MSKLEPTRTCSNPTANDILRRLLDERGVEHYDGTETTLWLKDGVGYRASADEGLNGYIHLHLWCTTPEQAIAATLGSCNCSDNCTNGERTGTCHADETDTWECVRDDLSGYGKTMTVHVMECSECGRTYEHVNGDYEFCPHCGRRVEVTDG